jgi:UDP-2,3-diacylglucosamine pyrophosphatase LpxH
MVDAAVGARRSGAAAYAGLSVRTLVISDLHLGGRLGRDVLRHPEALALLLDAFDGIDRLVLLGDVIELAEGRSRQALELAEPILRAIGERIGADRQIVLVPGNHDRDFARSWAQAQGADLAVDALVPNDASALLVKVVGWLAPARVEVRTPGVWLSSRVWATHGHYIDRHLLPESAYGMHRRRTTRERVGPAEYERARRPSVTWVETLVTRRLPRRLAALADGAADLVRASTMPSLPRRMQSHRLAPLARRVLGFQMQRAANAALAHVAARLGVDADWVVYGHVHRNGPRAGDEVALWSGPDGRPRLANTGCWIYEPLLLHRGGAPHPYWPGGAIVVEDDGDPHAIGLLDRLDVAALHAARPRWIP